MPIQVDFRETSSQVQPLESKKAIDQESLATAVFLGELRTAIESYMREAGIDTERSFSDTWDSFESDEAFGTVENFLAFLEFVLEWSEGGFKDLHERVMAIRTKIGEIKDSWRTFIEETMRSKQYAIYDELASYGDNLTLVRGGFGAGACYYLIDNEGIPQFVIKPFDEDIMAMNNAKGFFGLDIPLEEGGLWGVPRYMSHQIDMMASDLAMMLGVGEITPETAMVIIDDTDGTFFDLVKNVEGGELIEELRAMLGSPDGEKLCSIQRFVPNARELFEVRHELMQEGYRGSELAQFFDQDDFEQAMFFMMVSGELDGHEGNILAYVKRIGEDGKPIYGLRKIDNGLTFPELRTSVFTTLFFYENANQPFSKEMVSKILRADEEEIVKRMKELGLSDDAAEALKWRVQKLKEGALEGLTIEQIGRNFREI